MGTAKFAGTVVDCRTRHAVTKPMTAFLNRYELAVDIDDASGARAGRR